MAAACKEVFVSGQSPSLHRIAGYLHARQRECFYPILTGMVALFSSGLSERNLSFNQLAVDNLFHQFLFLVFGDRNLSLSCM
jgi:hypothetical protein